MPPRRIEWEFTLRLPQDRRIRIDGAELLDQSASRRLWRVTIEEFRERLRGEAQPDDLLVVFLFGHGLRDPTTGNHYHLTADARFADVQSGQFRDCLSFADFELFADLPCRKLVILNTCHSGAIQALQRRNLKAAVRALQDDVVFTLTASEGEQEAAEEKQRRLGRFTSRLLEALEGQADRPDQGGNGDGVVTFAEVVHYVRRMVGDDSARSAIPQYATAGPAELLEFAAIPLTRPASGP